MKTSPWVQRNADSAQLAQPRGSQYEGPEFGTVERDNERDAWDDELDAIRERVTLENVRDSGWPYADGVGQAFVGRTLA